MPRHLAWGLVALGLVACGEPADTRPGQPVTQRRQAFKRIVKDFEPMGVQLRKGPFDAKTFLALAEQLDAHKSDPWDFFGPDTLYPPSQAKPAIWAAPDQFAANKTAFLTASDGLLAAARSGDEAAIRKAYEAVHDTCRDCHKRFKD